MMQNEALGILHAGQSVLLTGAAGTGKTYTLNQFVRYARAHGKTVAMTATTGLAATHLNGTTIHAWAGIGVHDELPKEFGNKLSKQRRDIISKTDVLVIDEISMLHDYRLDMVDAVCRLVRENDKPFGGIQVIMSGDFFQLPPINRGDSRAGGFVVNSTAWQELQPVICYLEEQHRQDDEQLVEILNALRALRAGAGERPALTAGTQGLIRRFSAEHDRMRDDLSVLRDAAHQIGAGDPAALDSLRAADTFLQDTLLPHEDAEDSALYPELARPLGSPEATATMSRMHAEIHRLSERLHTHREVADENGGVRPEQADDLLACLYGLYALLCLHFVQEEENFFVLAPTYLDPADQ